MAQKVIKIGSSAGVIIPKKELEQKGVKVGDEIEYDFKPAGPKHQQKLMDEYRAFVAEYGQTLKNLAKR